MSCKSWISWITLTKKEFTYDNRKSIDRLYLRHKQLHLWRAERNFQAGVWWLDTLRKDGDNCLQKFLFFGNPMAQCELVLSCKKHKIYPAFIFRVMFDFYFKMTLKVKQTIFTNEHVVCVGSRLRSIFGPAERLSKVHLALLLLAPIAPAFFGRRRVGRLVATVEGRVRHVVEPRHHLGSAQVAVLQIQFLHQSLDGCQILFGYFGAVRFLFYFLNSRKWCKHESFTLYHCLTS